MANEEKKQVTLAIEIIGTADLQRHFSNHAVVISNENDNTVGLEFLDLGVLSNNTSDYDKERNTLSLKRKPTCRVVLPLIVARGLKVALETELENFDKRTNANKE